MATITENFKLSKPELSDTADITVQNSNWDIIDLELQKLYATVDSMGEVSSAEGTATLGNMADGEEFVLNESGVPTKFVKLTTNYNDSGRVLVIRKHLLTGVPFNSVDQRDYVNGELDTFCNQTYLGRLDENVRSQIINVDIQYREPYTLAVGTISRAGFALSVTELSSAYPSEGTSLDVFNTNESRVAYFNGVANSYWTRSIYNSASYNVAYNVNGTGGISTTDPKMAFPVRPAFTLPSDLSVTTVILLSTGNMGGTATVSE